MYHSTTEAITGALSLSLNTYSGESIQDWIAQEVPIALVYNGISHVVMMGTPDNLEDFALGFSLTEGIIDNPSDIYSISIQAQCNGIEVQIALSSQCFMRLKQYRRSMTGRTGCGICGVEHLSAIAKPLPTLPYQQSFSLHHLDALLGQLHQRQTLGKLTGSTHAAAWISPLSHELEIIREDVGRHVALDKLLGYLAKENIHGGVILVSSRASYEMVQKVASCGFEILLAVSAATTMAIEIAQKHHLTLLGFCRKGKASVYTHPQRIVFA